MEMIAILLCFCQRFLIDELQDTSIAQGLRDNFNHYFDTSPAPIFHHRPTAEIPEVSHVICLAHLDQVVTRLFATVPNEEGYHFKEMDAKYFYFHFFAPYFESQTNANTVKLYESFVCIVLMI